MPNFFASLLLKEVAQILTHFEEMIKMKSLLT
jgi:hypothetical protein